MSHSPVTDVTATYDTVAESTVECVAGRLGFCHPPAIASLYLGCHRRMFELCLWSLARGLAGQSFPAECHFTDSGSGWKFLARIDAQQRFVLLVECRPVMSVETRPSLPPLGELTSLIVHCVRRVVDGRPAEARTDVNLKEQVVASVLADVSESWGDQLMTDLAANRPAAVDLAGTAIQAAIIQLDVNRCPGYCKAIPGTWDFPAVAAELVATD